jgi:hypothetical protein
MISKSLSPSRTAHDISQPQEEDDAEDGQDAWGEHSPKGPKGPAFLDDIPVKTFGCSLHDFAA